MLTITSRNVRKHNSIYPYVVCDHWKFALYIFHNEKCFCCPQTFCRPLSHFMWLLLNKMITKHGSVLSQDNSSEHTSSFWSKPLTKRCFHPERSINTVYSCQRNVKRCMKFKDKRVWNRDYTIEKEKNCFDEQNLRLSNASLQDLQERCKISICQANKATRPGSILSFTKKKKRLLSIT